MELDLTQKINDLKSDFRKGHAATETAIDELADIRLDITNLQFPSEKMNQREIVKTYRGVETFGNLVKFQNYFAGTSESDTSFLEDEDLLVQKFLQ